MLEKTVTWGVVSQIVVSGTKLVKVLAKTKQLIQRYC